MRLALVPILAAALSLASLASAASGAVPTPCAKRVSAAGGLWSVSTTRSFPCGTAARFVRRLAPRTAPLPVGRYPGTYAGLVCVGRAPGARPLLIVCGNPSRGRGFTAARRS